MAALKRSTRNIKWIERWCRIPDGIHVGEPAKLCLFQKKILRGIYDTPTRRAIISVGRKNAKTTLAAWILLLHLCGPEVRHNSELYSTALSRDQAAITFRLAAKCVRLSPELNSVVTIRDTVKQLYCTERGTLYTALSADASTAMGLSPVLTIHDELGQVKGPRHPLYEALETATGAQAAPLSVIISTQAPTDADLLSVLIDDAKLGHDPRVKLFFWTADMDARPFTKKAIMQANPAFSTFMNQREILDMADAAKRMPSREAEYRNLILNQRIEAENPFVQKSDWDLNAGAPAEFDGEVYIGLDLSETADLTAMVAVSINDGVYSCKPTFWLPEEGLEERARQDRVPYDVWAKDKFLQTTPGRSIQYEYVAHYLAQMMGKYDVRRVAFDRWNMRHLRPWLIKAGIPEDVVDVKFEPFGQGYQSMSPAVRTLEEILLAAKLRHGAHPVLTMCAVNAVVKADEAGGRKLDKKRSRGRIDGMVALLMAVAMAAEDTMDDHVYRGASIETILEQITA